MRTFIRCALLVLALITLLGFGAPSAVAQPESPAPVTIYLFWGDGCPHCAREKAFLDALLRHDPDLRLEQYEVWYVPENQALFARFGEAFGFQPGSVPATFIGDRYWIGYGESTGAEFVEQIGVCSSRGCRDIGADVVAGTGDPNAVALDPALQQRSAVTLPVIGRVDLAAQPLWLSTALISFVDGFNPCSLWVLSILLALVLHSGSRKRIMLVGVTFLTVTATAYILFIVGLFGVFSFLGSLAWIQLAVAGIAFAFAAINVKDYFWYKDGISLTIDDRRKPGLYRDMRGLIASGRSPLAIVGATAALALGVTLLELPCTSGLPLMWTNMIAANDVPAGGFALLLALYMVVFLLDELALFLTAVFTLRVARFEEKHGRILKLGGGIVMFALAAVMLIDPALMNDVGASALVFAAALGATALVLVLHRRVLPSLGIRIGTELKPSADPRRVRRIHSHR